MKKLHPSRIPGHGGPLWAVLMAVTMLFGCPTSSSPSNEASAEAVVVHDSVTRLDSITWPESKADALEFADAVEESMRKTGGRPVLVNDDSIWMVVLETKSDLDVVRRVPSSGIGRGGETFTRAASRVDQEDQVDVVINGMTYSLDSNLHRQGSKRSTHAAAHGQALQSGEIVGGQQLRPTTSRFHFIQRSDGGGRDASDWVIESGNHDAGTGLSGAMAILYNGKKIGHPGGIANSDTDKLLRLPKGAGMPYVGIDESRQMIWVVVKNWGPSKKAERSKVEDVRQVFDWMGMKDAIALDGGDSVCLAIDGVVLVRPSDYKDRSIPFGLRFSWHPSREDTRMPAPQL